MSFLVGTSVEGNNGILDKELPEFGSYLCISDHGKPGRILDYLDKEITRQTSDGTDIRDIAFYLIGPEIFMKTASGKLREAGMPEQRLEELLCTNALKAFGIKENSKQVPIITNQMIREAHSAYPFSAWS